MEDNSKKIKIAQVIGNAQKGGVINCVMNFFRHIDRDKVQFDFYTYAPSPFDDEIRALGGRVFHYPVVFNFFKCVRHLKKAFKAEGYDIVHVHMTTLSFVGLLAAKLAGVKHRICHAHSATNKDEGFVWFVKSVLKHISRWFPTELAGCSRLSIDWLYGKRASQKAYLLHNAIELDRFDSSEEQRAQSKRKYGLEGYKVVGNIGRFEFQKNIPFLIKAFGILCKSRDDVRLALVGGGSQLDEAKRLVNALDLQDKVLFLTEQKNVQEYFALFDAFALPSKYEGLPLVAIEAQAMGLPCLLSDCITKEADVTGHVKYLPIVSASFWAQEIDKTLNEDVGYDGKAALKDAGYDINEEAKRLLQYYTDVANR